MKHVLNIVASCALCASVHAQCEVARLDPNGPVNVGPQSSLSGAFVVFPVLPATVILFRYDLRDGWVEGPSFVSPGGGIFYAMTCASWEGDVVAGFPDGSSGEGAAFLHERATGWSVATPLTPSDVRFGDVFGASVAIHGDTIVVGATMDLFMYGSGPGKAYVLERDRERWTTAARFAPHGFSSWYASYGLACATDGETVVVGSPGDDEAGAGVGAAYVYERSTSGWIEVAKLLPASPASDGRFGSSVAVEGKRIAVGAPQALGTGLAYVFERSSGAWLERAAFSASDSAGGDIFGASLDLAGERLAVGAPHADGSGADTGVTYVFRAQAGAWAEELRIAPEVPSGTGYGSRVDLQGNQVLVAPGLGPEVRLHSLGVEQAERFCDASRNSTGARALLFASGCDSVAGNGLRLAARPVPTREPGFFLFARHADRVPFGNGLLCLASPLQRGPAALSDGGGELTAELDFEAGPGALVLAGASWRFQAVFRDPGYLAGFGTSDALRITFQP